MILRISQLIFLVAILFLNDTYSQPLITEDRMYLKFSSDVVKAEWDIYLPRFTSSKYRHLVRWEYNYKNSLLISEKSYPAEKH